MYYTIIHQFIDYLRYRKAVQQADEAHAETGNRYYVMPMHGTKKPKLVIMDRKNFRRLRMKHYIGQNASVRDLVNECFYCTPYKNGEGHLDARGRHLKLQLYYSYCRAVRKLKIWKPLPH